MRPILALSLALLAWYLAGCLAQPSPSVSGAEAVTDGVYLTRSLWDDGQAEVAFYQVDRSRTENGESVDESFVAGSYLVKHDFDPLAMTKAAEGAAERVSAFKYAFFYEYERGSYQFKHSYVANATQADLTPLKASFMSFDWCSNRYEEMAFHPNGTVDALMRSDDYGNRAARFDARPNAYPPHLVPLLIRSLDYNRVVRDRTFYVVQDDGTFVRAVAHNDGITLADLQNASDKAERIIVTYDAPVRSVLVAESDTVETYWRGTGPERLLLKMEGASGRYRMTLVEELRTPYWQENLWPKLTRVSERP